MQMSITQQAAYRAVMARIEVLMLLDPATDTDEGRELSLLTDLAMFYERDILPTVESAHELKCEAALASSGLALILPRNS